MVRQHSTITEKQVLKSASRSWFRGFHLVTRVKIWSALELKAPIISTDSKTVSLI